MTLRQEGGENKTTDRPIERIVPGDLVLSRDQLTGQQCYKPVKQTFVTHPSVLYHVKYRAREQRSRAVSAVVCEEGGEDGESELVCTGSHPFYVIGRGGFVPAEELRAGYELLLADGRTGEVVGVATEKALDATPFTTYNFEVEDFHTYFVGEKGVWVHNACSANGQLLISLHKAKLEQKGLSLAKGLEEIIAEGKPLSRNAEGMSELVESVLKQKYGENKIFWSLGDPNVPSRSGASNLWRHFTEHFTKKKNIPKLLSDPSKTISDPVTYYEETQAFLANPNLKIIPDRVNPQDGLLDTLYFDRATGNMAIKITQPGHPLQNVPRTYFTPNPDPSKGWDYFLRQGTPIN